MLGGGVKLTAISITMRMSRARERQPAAPPRISHGAVGGINIQVVSAMP